MVRENSFEEGFDDFTSEDALWGLRQWAENATDDEAARNALVEQWMSHLVGLLESGDWMQDDHGNVYPSTLSPEDRAEIAESSRFSILDRPIRYNEVPGTPFQWRAVGSVLCSVDVHRVGDLVTEAPLTIEYSVLDQPAPIQLINVQV